MPLIFAIFSADCPMVSPVDGSAMAGVIGTRSFGRMRESALTLPPMDLARDADTRASENPRECRMGTFDNDSAPPAMTTDAWPSAIWSAASVIAWLADAQARLTVTACTPFGSMGSSETSRAMFGAMTDGTTVPNTRASTSRPSSAVRWISSATHALPRSMAEMFLKAVPERANGVRTPETIATRRPLPKLAMAGTYSGITNRESGRDRGSTPHRHNAGNVPLARPIGDQPFFVLLNLERSDEPRQFTGVQQVRRVPGSARPAASHDLEMRHREGLVHEHPAAPQRGSERGKDRAVEEAHTEDRVDVAGPQGQRSGVGDDATHTRMPGHRLNDCPRNEIDDDSPSALSSQRRRVTSRSARQINDR